MTIKKIIGFLHLWLGLASGLVIFIVAVTGAMYVFQGEIDGFVNRKTYYVAKQNRPHAPMQVWLDGADNALKKYPGLTKGRSLYWSKNSNRVVAVGASYVKGKEEHYAEALINPYTGAVVKVKDGSGFDFWRTVIDLHVNLKLGEIGSHIVRYSTLIFLLMLITGIVLWWPKNKPALKQRYKFSWKNTTKWKRKNYDLHNIPGFYASWIVVFMAITGLVWSFTWFSNGLYMVLSGKAPVVTPEVKEALHQPKTDISQLELAFLKMKNVAGREDALASSYYVSYPSDTSGTIYTSLTYNPPGIIEEDYKYYVFDRVKLNITESTKRANAGDWFLAFNGQIHYGSIFGLASKLLVFFACLIAASLPVTGFYIWWGRKKKTGKASPVKMIRRRAVTRHMIADVKDHSIK